MKLKNPMLVVTDIDRSVEFYKKVFGLLFGPGGDSHCGPGKISQM